jgi:hypothetical protein
MRRLAVALALNLVLGAAVGSAQVVVLKVEKVSTDPKGTTTITLASGAKIIVPTTDIDQPLTKSTSEAAALAEWNATRSGPALPTAAGMQPQVAASPTTAQAQMRAKCAADWPSDFRMRAYCETRQQDGLLKLNARSMTFGDRKTIRDECLKDWANDFQMRNYCEEQQLEALAKLGR